MLFSVSPQLVRKADGTVGPSGLYDLIVTNEDGDFVRVSGLVTIEAAAHRMCLAAKVLA